MEPKAYFSDVGYGEKFTCRGNTYLRLTIPCYVPSINNSPSQISLNTKNAVNINTGSLNYFDEHDEVIKVREN